jgi:hypothetical protein
MHRRGKRCLRPVIHNGKQEWQPGGERKPDRGPFPWPHHAVKPSGGPEPATRHQQRRSEYRAYTQRDQRTGNHAPLRPWE